MAGGDGSLAAVASTALATDAAFVCVPFGTRNHFARDVGLDRDDPFGGLLQVARHRRRLHARVNGEKVDARVLVVGNNRYELSLFTLGERQRLDEGLLQLWVAAGLLPTAWDERTEPAFRVELPGAHVRAAIDGEPVTLESPFVFESLPGALRLLVPQRAGESGTIGSVMPDKEEE